MLSVGLSRQTRDIVINIRKYYNLVYHSTHLSCIPYRLPSACLRIRLVPCQHFVAHRGKVNRPCQLSSCAIWSNRIASANSDCGYLASHELHYHSVSWFLANQSLWVSGMQTSTNEQQMSSRVKTWGRTTLRNQCHNQPLGGWLLVKISHGKRSMSEKCWYFCKQTTVEQSLCGDWRKEVTMWNILSPPSIVLDYL